MPAPVGGDTSTLRIGDMQLDQLPSSMTMDPAFMAKHTKDIEWADEGATGSTSSHTEHVLPSNNYYKDTKAAEPRPLKPPSWTAQQASYASGALIKYAIGPTLLPPQIAELISNLSLLARVSLKSAAFFIEVILEAAKYGTGMGLSLTRRALIGAVGTARALHSIGTNEGWDAKSAGRSGSIANSVKNANEAFLSILDKYTAVGIYLIHHTFTMAELFAMSGFYVVSSTINTGLSAADESVRTIDGIFGSNETSRALASFITLVRTEFSQDPEYADTSCFGILASLTKAITAFAVLQNSTFKRSAKGMKMRVVYDCTVLGEVEAKSWRAMIVGSGNFVKSRADQESVQLMSAVPPRTSSSQLRISPSTRHLDLPATRSDKDKTSSQYDRSMNSLPSGRPRSTFGDSLCLTDISPAYKTPGWVSSSPASPTESKIFPSSPMMPDDRSILTDLDFLVGTDEGDPVDDSVATVHPDDLPGELRRRLNGFNEEELKEGVVIEAPSDQNNPAQVRHFVRKLLGRGKHETEYEIMTEVTETIETVTTVEERKRSGVNGRGSEYPAHQDEHPAPHHQRGGSSFTERDVTSTRSEVEIESIFEGGRQTTLEEEDEWCEIARTTNTPASRSTSASTVRAFPCSDDSDAMAVDDLAQDIPEVQNGKPMALVRRTGHDDERNGESSSKMQVVLKTMTKKLVQKRRTIRKIEIHSDTEDDALSGRIQGRSMDIDDDLLDGGRVEIPHRRSAKTAPSSPKALSRPLPTSRYRQFSPLAQPKTTNAHSQNGEMSSGFHRVMKMAKNTLKNANQSGSRQGPKTQQRSSSSSQNPSPKSNSSAERGSELEDERAPRSSMPEITIEEPSTPTPKKQDARLSIPLRELDTPAQANSRSKRTASPFEASETKAQKQAGLSSPKKSTSGRGAGKELPQIPSRGGSNRHSGVFGNAGEEYKYAGDRYAAPPASPFGSMRDNKRRSRAPSITSINSFASRKHMQSTASGPSQLPTDGPNSVAPGAFPRAYLVQNLYRFMRYSSAAYGQNLMRILGIGSLDYFFPDTSKHNANVWAFAHHVGIAADSILLNSFSEPQPLTSERMSPLVNYVAVDEEAKAVVLTCRGTMGLSDLLTDLTCTYEDIEVQGGKPSDHYQVHSGMLVSAKRLSASRSTVMTTIRHALDANPEYGLVVTGHSLGGGVAALLAILLGCPAQLFQDQVLEQRRVHGIFKPIVRHPKISTPFVTGLECGLPPGRPIHAYAYGVPAVASPDLVRYCKGLVTSIIYGHDFVPSLSLGMVRDMKNISHTLSAEKDSDMAQEIVGKVLGLYQKRKAALKGTEPAGLLDNGPDTVPKEIVLEPEELKEGRTRNWANDSNYRDPRLEDTDDPFSYAPGGINRNESNLGAHLPYVSGPYSTGLQGPSYGQAKVEDPDADMQDWLWSLIKTIRADMTSSKLYPPGEVYCIESFAVFVTPSTNRNSSTEAHRVILRYCEDVEKRFSEPIFAKSMLRDHIPTNYELCMSLLYESGLPRPEEY